MTEGKSEEPLMAVFEKFPGPSPIIRYMCIKYFKTSHILKNHFTDVSKQYSVFLTGH